MDYFYTVYKVTNKTNKKVYVGMHQTTDLDDGYMGSGRLIQRAIEKYGIDNFEKEYLAVFDTAEEMIALEKEIVNESFVKRNDNYNMRTGGHGGDTSAFIDYENDEFRRKLSASLKDMFRNNPEQRERNARHLNAVKGSWLGRTHREESKKKISEKLKILQKGKNNSQYGTCWIYSERLRENKKIHKNELDSFLERGWSRGRKMKWNK